MQLFSHQHIAVGSKTQHLVRGMHDTMVLSTHEIGSIYLLTNAMKTEWQHRRSYFQAHLAVKIAIWQLLLSLRNISHLFIKTLQMNGTHIL